MDARAFDTGIAVDTAAGVMSEGDFKIGLTEVQVGLVVPRQIQRVLARLVGIRRAERLLVAGALLSPQEALHAGLVDDVVEGYEETIARAIEWCRKRTALPHNAMSGTRKIIRADTVSNYDDLEEADMKAFSDVWFSEETQRIIGQVLQKLQKKAG
jgi:enoyl-CoA hydratase/carnithine racemase